MREPRRLTPGEWRAIEELKAGGLLKEVALRLGISPNTLKEKLKSIYTKLEVHSARELLVKLYLQPAPAAPATLAGLRALEAILDAPHATAALAALATAVEAELDLRAAVMAPKRNGRHGFLAEALQRGEARSDYGVAELPGWAPPLGALRLAWESGERAVLVMSDPRRRLPAAAWRRAALLARFAEAALAQGCAARPAGG